MNTARKIMPMIVNKVIIKVIAKYCKNLIYML